MTTALLTPNEAAIRARVHPSSIRRWVDAGLIVGVRRTPGGRIRLPADSVDQLLKPDDAGRHPHERDEVRGK